jgi:hypothetical protein
MDPRGHPRPLSDGASCTACGSTVPAGGIRFLARRDDVAFVELACPGCGSQTLGLLLSTPAAGDVPILDVAGDATAARSGTAHLPVRPVSAADVEAIRADLAAWDGDLVGWLEVIERDESGRSVVDR